jgi:serine protease
VINLSFGSPGFSVTEQVEYTEVRAQGVILVAAAGNDGSTTPSYPASYAGVISVAAVDANQVQAPYSNSGPSIAVAAPGGNGSAMVLSTWVNASSGTRTPDYAWMEGTSMAAPHVAGVVALMKASCPSLTPDQFDYLLSTGQLTVDLGAPGRDDIYGYGLIDAVKAVQGAVGQCGKPIPPVLQISPSRLDLAPEQTSATLVASKTGAETPVLSITGVVASVPWLTVSGPSPTSGNGLGTYTITADTVGLTDGVYAVKITFAVQNGQSPTVDVPVTVQKGAFMPSDLGALYVLLLDKDMKGVAQQVLKSTDGLYPFAFPGVPDGSYYLAAGTDLDNDNMICDAGEACGAWPTLGMPSQVVVKGGDVTGLDFVAGFRRGGGSVVQVGPGIPLAPAPKSLARGGR